MSLLIACILIYHFELPWWWYIVAAAVFVAKVAVQYGVVGSIDRQFAEANVFNHRAHERLQEHAEMVLSDTKELQDAVRGVQRCRAPKTEY